MGKCLLIFTHGKIKTNVKKNLIKHPKPSEKKL